jgi:hypothetical protein
MYLRYNTIPTVEHPVDKLSVLVPQDRFSFTTRNTPFAIKQAVLIVDIYQYSNYLSFNILFTSKIPPTFSLELRPVQMKSTPLLITFSLYKLQRSNLPSNLSLSPIITKIRFYLLDSSTPTVSYPQTCP